jgi:predicted amidohydrolase
MEELFVRAAQKKPRLILTTEGALEGYVVMEIVEGRATAEAMLEVAEPIDGPYIRRFQELARTLNTCLAFGFAERIGDEAFNCALFLDQDGEICGRYHKVQLAEGTHPSWQFNRVGHRLRAFDTPIGRAGFVICNDRWNPRITRTLVLDGARLILIPSYGSKGRNQNETVLRRARENGVPIVNANVGMNLIVSQGEIVAYRWGNDAITTAEVEVPAAPSTQAARAYEAEYVALQGPEMERRYEETIKRLRGEDNVVELAQAGELVSGT